MTNHLLTSVRRALISGGGKISYLLRDEFTTADATPITSPRTCEPGPGTIIVTDTQNFAAIIAGEVITTDINATGDPGIWDNAARTRTTGLLVSGIVSSDERLYLGFDSDQAGAIVPSGILFYGTTLRALDGGVAIISPDAYVNGSDYTSAVILRTAGSFCLIKGQAFGEWTLLWVADSENTASLYAAWAGRITGNDIGTLDSFRVAQLSNPWLSDYSIATDRLAGARSAGDTFTHEADCIIEFEATTVPAANQIEVEFRQQTANTDMWRVTIDSAGTIDLDEVVATVVNQRGTSVGTIANGERVMVFANDNDMAVYGNNTSLITYAVANNFKTETAGELETEITGGSVSDIISWPRILSGQALIELDKYTS